jgi:hypothetical protein
MPHPKARGRSASLVARNERHLKLIFASFLLGKDGKSGTESAGRICPRAGARARVHSLLVLAQADQQLTKERMKDAEG